MSTPAKPGGARGALCAIMLLFAAAGGASAQTPSFGLPTDDYVVNMPTADEVVARVTGANAMDEAAREGAAFLILDGVQKDLASRRVFSNTLTPREAALRAAYSAAHGRSMAPHQSAGPSYYRLEMRYTYDDTFRNEVLDTLLKGDLREVHATVKGQNSQTLDRIQQANERQGQADRDLAAARMASPQDGPGIIVVFFGLIFLPGVIGLPALIASFRSSRLTPTEGGASLSIAGKTYALTRVAGALVGQTKSVTETPGEEIAYFDGRGVWQGTQGTAPVTTIKDTLVLQDATGERRRVTLTDTPLRASAGNTIALVLAQRKGSSKNRGIAVANLTQGQTHAYANELRAVARIGVLPRMGATLLSILPGAALLMGSPGVALIGGQFMMVSIVAMNAVLVLRDLGAAGRLRTRLLPGFIGAGR
jgi:hypothetical protein